MNPKRKIVAVFGIITIVFIIAGAGAYTVLNKEIQLQEPEFTPPFITDSNTKTIGEPTPTVTPKPTPTPTPNTPKAGNIEEIQEKLKEQAWVRVIVVLEGNQFTGPEFKNDVRRRVEVKKIQDTVLATLDEKDFQISHQYQNITAFSGQISESGLKKLLENPLVLAVSLDTPSFTQ